MFCLYGWRIRHFLIKVNMNRRKEHSDWRVQRQNKAIISCCPRSTLQSTWMLRVGGWGRCFLLFLSSRCLGSAAASQMEHQLCTGQSLSLGTTEVTSCVVVTLPCVCTCGWRQQDKLECWYLDAIYFSPETGSLTDQETQCPPTPTCLCLSTPGMTGVDH